MFNPKPIRTNFKKPDTENHKTKKCTDKNIENNGVDIYLERKEDESLIMSHP